MLLRVAFALLFGMAVGFTMWVLFGVGGFLWEQHPWVLGLVALAGGVLNALSVPRARRSQPWATSGGLPALHPGITLHSIPVAGGMGLIFTAGYVAMFWFGLPGVGPVVLCLAGIGLLFGGGRVFLGQRRSIEERDARVLHLEDTQQQH